MHILGYIPCDLKPDNAMVKGRHNQVIVCDFGLARWRLSDAVSRLTASTGAPLYAAPEVASRTDTSSVGVYSMGCCILHAISGAAPVVVASAAWGAGAGNAVAARPPHAAEQPNLHVADGAG
jgi:serine/threonine protein kinase